MGSTRLPRSWRSTLQRTSTACIRSTRASSTSAGRRSCRRRPSGSWRCSRSTRFAWTARAVVIGRSDIVGKPIAHLLLQANATVTICHSRTADLPRQTLEADVLVVAVGSAEFVTADMVKQGSAVVDVGINRTENGIVGDVDADAAEHAAFLTPVPGGGGPMTIAMLLRNTVKAARYRRGVLAFPQGWR